MPECSKKALLDNPQAQRMVALAKIPNANNRVFYIIIEGYMNFNLLQKEHEINVMPM